jgi:hypothetical protein
MLLEYHQGTLGPLEADKLQEYLKIAEDLRILRMDGESDEDYAERTIKIARLSAEIPKLFNDGSWDTGSVIDAVTLGLAGIISTNYKDDSKTVDPYIITLLADRIRYYRSESGQEPLPDWTDDAVKDLIKKFQVVDRPIGGEESEKLAYARRSLKALRTVESALAASDVTDFDVIEALCMELAVIFGKSPLPTDVIEALVARIPENAELLKKDSDDSETI